MRVVFPPAASSRIEIFEVSKSAVAGSGRPVGTGGTKAASGGRNLVMPAFDPATGFTGTCVATVAAGATPPARWFAFTGWALFHAAAKSMMLAHDAEEACLEAEAMSRQYAACFLWNQTIELVPRNLRSRRKDSARTDLAARLGEGLAHLVMQERFGYVYWDSLESVFERLTSPNAGHHPDMLKTVRANAPQRDGKEPDFVFETSAGDAALAECKGHFLEATAKRVPFGSSLRKGLDQLSGWPPLFTPTPTRSFAFNACLAERGAKAPSFVAYVDPEEENTGDGLPLGDAVRRGNYAAWLIAMGLPAHGEALRWYGPSPQTRVRLPVVRIGGRRYAVSGGPWGGPPWWVRVAPISFWDRDAPGWVVAGMDVAVLTGVKRALAGESLGHVAPEGPETAEPTLQPQVGDVGFSGSVMADGTLLGIVHSPRLFIDGETFAL